VLRTSQYAAQAPAVAANDAGTVDDAAARMAIGWMRGINRAKATLEQYQKPPEPEPPPATTTEQPPPPAMTEE